MKAIQLKQIILATVLAATTALAGPSSTSITLDPSRSLKSQGWKEVGGIAPKVEKVRTKKVLVFDDQSSSESSGCKVEIPKKMLKQAQERGYAFSITMRWEGSPVAHNIEIAVGGDRVFLTLSNTKKEQAVGVLGSTEPVGGKVTGPDKFHTWKFVRRSDGKTELYADGKKVAEDFPLTMYPPASQGIGIGGIHGTSKARTGRLEIESAKFEVM
jgi:hypothetical protein